jgi:hypothetical protein
LLRDLLALEGHSRNFSRLAQDDRLNELMASVNWYLTPHLRWVFDYGMGRVSGGPLAGNMFTFQTPAILTLAGRVCLVSTL